ncbi:MAG: hypothetical protein ACRD5Z_03410, partial [Bryobacteraceae bacterium]
PSIVRKKLESRQCTVPQDELSSHPGQNKEPKSIPIEQQAVSDAFIEKIETIYYFSRGTWIAITQSIIE